jgi:hypothetical protein
LLNVVASLAIGVGAIVLSLVAFSVSFLDLPLVLSPEGWRTTVPSPDESRERSSDLRRRYVVALDISGSFISPAKDRLAMARHLTDRLFLPAGWLGNLVKPGDCKVVMAFAGTYSVVNDPCESFQDPAALPAKIQQAFAKRIAEHTEHPDQTDVIRFIDNLVAELSAQGGQPTTVFLLSDLRQDAGDKKSSDPPSDQDLSTLANLRSRLAGMRDLRFLVVVDDSVTARGYRLQRDDLGLSAERWNEVGWETFKRADRERQLAALALGIYREEPLATMYLKYHFSRLQEGVPSTIVLPQSSLFGGLVFGLIPEDGDEDVARRLKIRVAMNGYEARVLSMESATAQSWIAQRSGETLSVTLAGAPDVQRFVRCNLLIAVPAASVTYRIPITVVPTFRGEACTLLKVLALFMVLSLGSLGFYAAWSYHSHQRGPSAGAPP